METIRSSIPPSTSVVRIEGVPRGEGIAVVFAGPIVGLFTHWASGRSHGCPGALKCPPTLHRGRTVWKGYAAIRRWTAVQSVWTAAVLEITEALEEQLRGRELMGEMWHLTRASAVKKSAQVSGIYYARRDEPELRSTFDIVPAIQRLYHSLELEFGATNQLPAKTLVEHVICAGPTTAAEVAPRQPSAPTAEQRERLRKLTGRLYPPPSLNGHTKKMEAAV
jgi:hypothetical protein